jgi:hypothetical protein
MTHTVDLTPDEEARLATAAREEGLSPEEILRRLVTEHLPAVGETAVDPTLALFAQWEREDAQMTTEEISEENRQWEEFKANVNAERERAGARPVF